MSDSLLRNIQETDIAVIGMSCRLPGADNVDVFWENLRDGVESITFFTDDELEVNDPALLNHPDYVKAGSVIPGIDLFDASFFGYGPKEAALMDPQQRIFLECAWEALENAGYDPEMFDGLIGVYAGTAMNTYLINNVHPTCGYSPHRTFLESMSDLQVLLGNGTGFMPTRVSYKLNLRGPSVNVQTACSTGLVAVHLACQSLLAGECDMVLAGAVTIRVPNKKGYLYQEGMIFSPDGHCRAFDARAQGTVFGDGAGIVVLKLLGSAIADGDGIHAVIKGSAINNDGSMKVGYSAPSVDGQTDVITQALAVADIDAATITYVETHGTGTNLGDPVEITALTRAFRESTQRALEGGKAYCAIGSVKTNIGHLAEAAGIAGLIKTVLALKHELLPPSLHFFEPNPNIDFANSPFYVNKQPSEWKVTDTPRLAGVSAFGMGGTNAHVILEEAPAATPESGFIERGGHLFTLSARSEKGLLELARRYEGYSGRQPGVSLADVCFTANTGRRHFSHRLAIVAKSMVQLHSRLAALRAGSAQEVTGVIKGQIGVDKMTSLKVAPSSKRIAFLFTGQGSQYICMGRQLYETQPAFRRTLELCDNILRDEGCPKQPLLDLLFPLDGKSSPLNQTAYAQPALFALEYALAKMWDSWGIRPDVVIGHSVGEYVAACVAGVFSLEDGLRLVAERGRLMQATKPGEMVAVWASEAQVITTISKLQNERPRAGVVTIAAINGPDSVVISGTHHAVQAACAAFAAQGIKTKKLRVSHAFHSPLMEPILTALEQAARGVTWSRPQLKLISNVTGLVADEEVAEPAYWIRHARQPVQFAAGMKTLGRLEVDVLLEIGPDPVLLGLGRSSLPDHDGLWLPSLRQRSAKALHTEQDDWEQLLTSVGKLHVHGVPVDWFGFDRDYVRHRIHLPTYPFQQKRYWIEAPNVRDQSDSLGKHPLLGRQLILADTREIRFQSRISANSPAWLKEHRVFQSTILPGTCFLEMALAAGAATPNSGVLSLSDVHFLETLNLPDVPHEGTTVQVILTPEGSHRYGFRIYSLTPAKNQKSNETWTLHASGKLLKDDQAGIADLPNLQAQCREEVSVDAFYQNFHQHGFDYGPTFKLVERLWRGGDAILGQVKYPEDLHLEAEEYQLHPVLLDACISVIGAVRPDQHKDKIYVTTGLESLRIYCRPNTDVWSYAQVREANGTSSSPIAERGILTVDLRLLAPDGQLLADIEGLQLKQVRREAISGLRKEPVQEELDEIEWQPQARYGLFPEDMPNPSEIYAYLQPKFRQLMDRPSMDSYGEALTRLEDISISYVQNAFVSMGWDFQLNQRFSTASIAAELAVINTRWLDRLLTMLEEVGILRCDQVGGRLPQGKSWEVISLPVISDAQAALNALSCPEAESEITLLKRCGTKLAQALQGTCNPIQVLFPEGATSEVAKFYHESPTLQAMNALMQETISYVLSRLPPRRGLRILEIGAGAGATTSYILPHLTAHQTEYVFTDVGASFLTQARARFRAYPFVSYKLLDIEQPLDDQGFESHQYDLVVAANVLHVTQDLGQTVRHVRQLLAPEGVLLMMEGTAPVRWVDVTFGFAEGWWRFADHHLRPDYPLVTVNAWQTLLTKSGFREVAAISTQDCSEKKAVLPQAVIIAQATSLAEGQTREKPAQPKPRHWLILADDTGVGQHLATRLRSAGDVCTIVFKGENIEQVDKPMGMLRADPTNSTDFQRLLKETIGDTQLHGVVHLWSLDSSDAKIDLDKRTEISRSSTLHLVQALASDYPSPPSLWLVTRGAQAVDVTVDGAAARVKRLHQSGATLCAIGKAIASKHPELTCVRIDLDANGTDDEVQTLFEEILPIPSSEHGVEHQVAFRNKGRYVARPIRGSRQLPDQSTVIQSSKKAAVPHVEFIRQLEQVSADKRRDLLTAYVGNQVSQVLGMDMLESSDQRMSRDQEFFDIGMDSLTSIELRSRLQRDLGRSLPSTLLYNYPTMEALVDYLGHEIFSGSDPRGGQQAPYQAPYDESLTQTWLQKESASHDSWCSTLVPIQPHGSKRPFFCVPGVLGDVSQFHQLARCLGNDQPFYGLRPPGLDEDTSPYDKMADIANHYIQAVQAAQPTGRYLLGGHSFGGLVAFEMAQQLLQRGHAVSVLVILDVQVAVGENYKDTLNRGAAQDITTLARVFERTLENDIEFLPDVVDSLDSSEQLNYLVQRLKIAGLQFTASEMRRIQGVFRANVQAMARYRPRLRYPTPITLFRASEVHPQDHFLPDEATTQKDPTWGWNQLSSARLDPHIVPGNHFTMMTDPNVQILGQQLMACLTRAGSSLDFPIKSSHGSPNSG